MEEEGPPDKSESVVSSRRTSNKRGVGIGGTKRGFLRPKSNMGYWCNSLGTRCPETDRTQEEQDSRHPILLRDPLSKAWWEKDGRCHLLLLRLGGSVLLPAESRSTALEVSASTNRWIDR